MERCGESGMERIGATAMNYKEKISAPLILVGGIRSPEVSESLAIQGLTDYVSLCRPLIREPNLITRWKDGNTAPGACIYCNGCFGPGLNGKWVQCIAGAGNPSKENNFRSS